MAAAMEPEGETTYSNSQRPTDDEFDEKVMFVYDLLAKSFKTSEIKKKFRAKYDRRKKTKSTDGTIRGYIKRARAVMLVNADVTRESERAESIAYWRSVISDPKQSPTEKRHARIRIEKILGVEAAIKIAPTNTDGEPLSFGQAMATLEALHDAVVEKKTESGE